MKKSTGIIMVLMGLFILFGNLIREGAFFEQGNLTWRIISPLITISIFGIIIALITITNKKQRQRRDHDGYYHGDHYDDFSNRNNSQNIRCHKCNAWMKKTDKFCSQCGEPAEGYVKCEYCGHLNPKSNALCENCNGFL